MKKPSSKLRAEIARLEGELKLAETREAERIGRIALKAGLGDIEVGETELREAFEDVAKRFRNGKGGGSGGKERGGASKGGTSANPASEAPGSGGEA